jgi:NADH:ubiquinone oxidoreductase subunit 4 (subunit M)
MISLLLLTPIVGSLLLLPLDEKTQKTQIKQIALGTSVVALFVSILI